MIVTLPHGGDYKVGTLLAKGDSNTKLSKSDKASKGYLTVGLSLSPALESGYQTCASSSKGCRAACLFTAGMGRFDAVRDARIAKTIYFFKHRRQFIEQLGRELQSANKRAKKQGKTLAVRLNVISDIMWENIVPGFFDTMFPDVQFYDYTKHYKRMSDYCQGKLPPNYHLTFSRSECNERDAIRVLDMGGNVAVVFDTLPVSWNRATVVNGDSTDLRFLDPKGTVIGLVPKGEGKKDSSGFVVRIALPLAA